VIRAHLPINPARNPSTFRRRFPIRLWYPGQHLLRQNPLPRSQFGTRRGCPAQHELPAARDRAGNPIEVVGARRVAAFAKSWRQG
jgi:hypothetical protein